MGPSLLLMAALSAEGFRRRLSDVQGLALREQPETAAWGKDGERRLPKWHCTIKGFCAYSVEGVYPGATFSFEAHSRAKRKALMFSLPGARHE